MHSLISFHPLVNQTPPPPGENGSWLCVYHRRHENAASATLTGTWERRESSLRGQYSGNVWPMGKASPGDRDAVWVAAGRMAHGHFAAQGRVAFVQPRKGLVGAQRGIGHRLIRRKKDICLDPFLSAADTQQQYWRLGRAATSSSGGVLVEAALQQFGFALARHTDDVQVGGAG